MTQLRTLQETVHLLAQLRGSDDLPPRLQSTVERLCERLIAPIRVGIYGADADHVGAVFDGLVAAIGNEAVVQTADSIQHDGLVIIRHDRPSTAERFGQTDIAVWATSLFDATEAATWTTASDRLKDHSFLIALYDHNAPAPDARGAWVDAALDDFAGFLAVPINGQLAQAGLLLRALTDSAGRGRQADQDSADMIIESLQDKVTFSTPAAPTSQPAPTLGKMRKNVWQRASQALKAKAQELSVVSSAGDTPNYSEALSICVAASETLTDLFQADEDGDEFQTRFRDDVFLAADNILLMSLEDNESSAIDATTTLLQLQKDIQLQLSIR